MIFSLTIFAVVISLLSSVSIKYKKIFIVVSVLTVIFFYFFISKSFFHEDNFLPDKNIYICDISSMKYKWHNIPKRSWYTSCYNYYNILADSLKSYKISLFKAEEFKDFPDRKLLSLILQDTSLYKEKLYLYFGITPVLLFYLPFNLLTGLYLTDKFLVFCLSCLSFLLSLFLASSVFKSVINRQRAGFKNGKSYSPFSFSISCFLESSTVFLLGFCSWLPFLVIRSAIYEAAIITANVLLLCSFIIFYYYLDSSARQQTFKSTNILIFLLGLFLSLAAGARPHYILFIPVFIAAVILAKYTELKQDDKKGKTVWHFLKPITIFLIPCIIYGVILALYNYLRFDSFFEFGWKYQLNGLMQKSYTPNLEDFLTGLTNNLFQLPASNINTVFSLAKAYGHRIGNEYIVGIFWTCPIIIFLLFIPLFLKRIYKENKNLFAFVSVLIFIIIINMTVAGFIGMVNRYFAEYLSFMIILSVIVFRFLYNETENKYLKSALNLVFFTVFIYSIFINISLLFCDSNALYFVSSDTSLKNYLSLF